MDIDPGAIEIAKLRLWLTLVVDYEIKDIEPLPNLDYRLMCGNSLLEEFEGVKFYNGKDEKPELSLFVDTTKRDKVAELKKKVEEYFDIHDDEEKPKKRKEINDIKDWLIRTALEKRKKEISALRKREHDKVNMLDKKSREKYFSGWGDKFLAEAKINEVLENLHNPKKAKPFFIWKLEFIDIFEEKNGFDVVIANPPYDVYEGHRRGEIEEIRRYALYEKTMGGKLNAYKLFLAKSLTLQKPGGTLCEIFQNSFLADSSAKNIRKYFLENQKIIRIDSFPERDDIHRRVFENVKMSVCILLSNNIKTKAYLFKLNIWNDKYMSSAKEGVFSNEDILNFDMECAAIPSVDIQEIKILKKVSSCPRLKKIAFCYQGEINLTVHNKLLHTKKNKFAPVVKGAAIQKWHLLEKMSQGEVVYLDEKKYLAENKGSKSKHHSVNRIVTQGITGVDEKFRLKATYLNEGNYCAHSVNYILVVDSKVEYQYLLALLNSNLLNWYFKCFSTNSNVNGYEVNNLPVPENIGVRQKAFIEIVDKILAITQSSDYLKESSKQAKVKEYERQIDQMVYELYGLTEREIKIVEDFTGG